MWKSKHGERIKQTLISEAIQISTGIRGSKHAAALVYRGRVVAIGHNKLKSHPIMKDYHRVGQVFLHAEADVIQKTVREKRYNLQDLSLWVLRVTAKGLRLADSKPCSGCSRLIDHYGIEEVYWT